MKLKFRHSFILYLTLAHLIFAITGVLTMSHHRKWLIIIELLLFLSFLAGIRLIRQFSGTIDLLRTGAEFIAEQDFSSQFSPAGHAEMDQLVNIYNQMIVRLRQERLRLQEQHFFLEQIVTASPMGILTLDLDGRIDRYNPAAARILQREHRNIHGSPPASLPAPFDLFLSSLETGEARVVSVGGWRKIKGYKGQFYDRGFSRTFFLLEELTGELRQSEKAAYEKLIRLMSHEVNNTVAAASSLLQSCLPFAAQLQPGDRADYEMALQAIIGRTADLNSFMKRYAEVVRLPKPIPQPCNLKELLEDLRIFLSGEMNERQIAWEWDLPASPPAICLDRNLMEQALLNIIRNAMEAIASHGTVTIRLFQEGEVPGMVIADTGPGLPPDSAGKLFTPFFSTKPNGQGIGLTLVREILEGHQFPFSLDRAGGETRFTILFSKSPVS